jgi:hypothetical protein
VTNGNPLRRVGAKKSVVFPPGGKKKNRLAGHVEQLKKVVE